MSLMQLVAYGPMDNYYNYDDYIGPQFTSDELKKICENATSIAEIILMISKSNIMSKIKCDLYSLISTVITKFKYIEIKLKQMLNLLYYYSDIIYSHEIVFPKINKHFHILIKINNEIFIKYIKDCNKYYNYHKSTNLMSRSLGLIQTVHFI